MFIFTVYLEYPTDVPLTAVFESRTDNESKQTTDEEKDDSDEEEEEEEEEEHDTG